MSKILRFVQHSYLKPEKVEEYVKLHRSAWPGVLRMIQECNIHHYSISLFGTELYTYFEYTGENYEADMEKMAADPVTQEWWQHTRPCFLYHEEGRYYEDMEELFYVE